MTVAEVRQVPGAKPLHLLRVDRTDPAIAARHCNRALDLSFSKGAHAAVVVDERVHVDEHVLFNICSQADPQAAEPAVLWAAVTGASRSDRPARYLAGYYWCRADLRWKQELGYLWVGHGQLACQAGADLPCLWLAVISKAAWARVGPFDPALGAYADLDWALRARKVGVRFQLLVSEHVRVDELPVPAIGAGAGDDAAMTLRLARRHGHHGSWVFLAARRVGRCLAAEARKVQFRADYGQPLGAVKRTYWYLRALAALARRPALRLEVAAVGKSLAPTRKLQLQDE